MGSGRRLDGDEENMHKQNGDERLRDFHSDIRWYHVQAENEEAKN